MTQSTVSRERLSRGWLRLRAALPIGGLLPRDRWVRRHRLLLITLGLQIPMLVVMADNGRGDDLVTIVGIVMVVVTTATAAWTPHRRAASLLVALGLSASISVGVAVSGGSVVAIVLMVVLLGFIALYHDWLPYLAALVTALVGLWLIVLVQPALLGRDPIGAGSAMVTAVLITGVLLLSGLGSLLSWKVSEDDLTSAQSSMREMLDVQQSMLQKMQATEKLKDDLLSVVSHEFRTPLTAIIGFSQTLRRSAEMGHLPPEIVQLSAERIEGNGLRLSRLIGNMLASSMAITPHLERFYPVEQTLMQIVEELTTPGENATAVEVHVDPTMTARMSREHLRLLLGNLVDNGMKFADPDTALQIRGRMAGDEIALTFTNRGPEIPEEMREQVFARFVQVDLSDTRPYDGVGLGLHVVRRLCDAHGGALQLRCQDGLVVLGVTLPAGPAKLIGVTGEVDHRPAAVPAQQVALD